MMAINFKLEVGVAVVVESEPFVVETNCALANFQDPEQSCGACRGCREQQQVWVQSVSEAKTRTNKRKLEEV